MLGVIRDVSWTFDNQRFFVAGEGKKEFARALLVDTGSHCGIIQGSTKQALSIDCTPNRPYRLAVNGEDSTLQLYSGPPFKLDSSTKHNKNFVNCIRFQCSGKLLAMVSNDRQLKIVEVKTGELVGGVEQAHEKSVMGVGWVVNKEDWLVTCGNDYVVKLWAIYHYVPTLLVVFHIHSFQHVSQQLLAVQACMFNQ